MVYFMNSGSSKMGHPRVVSLSFQRINKPFFKPLPFFKFWIDHFTIGPPSDSGYEYLLKQWVQSGDPKARQQCKINSFSYFEPIFFY